MAFALALKSVHDLPDGHGKIILTATTAIVVITVSFSHLCFTLPQNANASNTFEDQDPSSYKFVLSFCSFYAF